MMTPSEKILWHDLRAKRFHGLKFRRQVPIGSYVVDFACLEKKVIVEIDGSGHTRKTNIQSDWVRDQKLEGLGFTILRFTNDQVKYSSDVLEKILSVCSKKIV